MLSNLLPTATRQYDQAQLKSNKPMKRRVHTELFATLIMFASSLATAQAECVHPAKVLIERAVSDILEVYNNESARLNSDPEYLQAKIDELIVPYLDLETMTRRVVGKFWRRTNENQQKQLIEEFAALLNKNYTKALTEYTGETVTFAPFRSIKCDDRVMVRSTLTMGNGLSIPVTFKLHDEEGWRIYDVEAYSLSLVNILRLAFSSEIESTGIDGLIQALKERSK